MQYLWSTPNVPARNNWMTSWSTCWTVGERDWWFDNPSQNMNALVHVLCSRSRSSMMLRLVKLVLWKQITWTCTHACIHVQVYMHTHIHSFIHGHTNMYTHTPTCIHMHTHMHTHPPTHTHTHTHTFQLNSTQLTHSLAHLLTHSLTHPPTHPLTHSFTHSLPSACSPHFVADTYVIRIQTNKSVANQLLNGQQSWRLPHICVFNKAKL